MGEKVGGAMEPSAVVFVSFSEQQEQQELEDLIPVAEQSLQGFFAAVSRGVVQRQVQDEGATDALAGALGRDFKGKEGGQPNEGEGTEACDRVGVG